MLGIAPGTFDDLCWADFWEALDGRLWMMKAQNGETEPRRYTEKQAGDTRAWIHDKASKAGWI